MTSCSPRFRKLLPVLALLAAFPFHLAQAQKTTGSIVGQVRVSPGTEVGRPILIEVEARGAVVGSVYTDEEGRFGFNNLFGNIYHIKINDDAYLPLTESVLIDPETTAVRLVTMMLTARNPQKAVSASGMSGGNPHLINYAEIDSLYPPAAVREFKAGVKSDGRRKIDEAIKHYEKAVKLAPTFYHARNNLGTAYLTKKSYSAAQEQFEQAIHLNAEDGAAYFNLGNAFYLQARYDDARQWLDQGLAKEPSSAFGHFLKGSLDGLSGDPAGAEKELLRSLELDPKLGKAHLALVNLYLRQKKDLAAANELRAFLKNSPNDALAPQASQVLKRIDPGAQP
jgi:tetratricopeptide (TPR) repeat protein